MQSLIVRNKRVLSDYFGIQLETGEDLLKRTENNIKKFIKFYEENLFNVNYDKFKEFTKNTGLTIARVYHIKNSYNEFYVDELGIYAKFQNDYNITMEKEHIFKHHLTIHIYLDKIIKEKDCIYGLIDEQKKLIYKNNMEYDRSIYNGYMIRCINNDEDLSEKDKIEKILELVPKEILPKIEIEKIKQIECIYPFEDILILRDNGNLYVNGKLYAKNVRQLCHLTSYRTYIIFETENVEFYTNTLVDNSSIKFKSKKTLGKSGFFIAILSEDKDVFISTTGNEIWDDFDLDNSIDFYLPNIDNFTYTFDSDNKVVSLILMIDKKKILFPLDIIVRK